MSTLNIYSFICQSYIMKMKKRISQKCQHEMRMHFAFPFFLIPDVTATCANKDGAIRCFCLILLNWENVGTPTATKHCSLISLKKNIQQVNRLGDMAMFGSVLRGKEAQD